MSLWYCRQCSQMSASMPGYCAKCGSILEYVVFETPQPQRSADIIPFRTREQFDNERMQRAVEQQESQASPSVDAAVLWAQSLEILDNLTTLYKHTGRWSPVVEQHLMNVAIYVQGICQLLAGVHDGQTEGQQKQVKESGAGGVYNTPNGDDTTIINT